MREETNHSSNEGGRRKISPPPGLQACEPIQPGQVDISIKAWVELCHLQTQQDLQSPKQCKIERSTMDRLYLGHKVLHLVKRTYVNAPLGGIQSRCFDPKLLNEFEIMPDSSVANCQIANGIRLFLDAVNGPRKKEVWAIMNFKTRILRGFSRGTRHQRISIVQEIRSSYSRYKFRKGNDGS